MGENNNIENVESDVQSAVNYLKKVVVNDENFPEIKKKLEETLDYRLKMLEAFEVDLRTEFPYLFTHSALVSIIPVYN